MKEEKLDFDGNNADDLLKEALHYLNMIPRKRIDGAKTRDSYELASLISKYFKEIE